MDHLAGLGPLTSRYRGFVVDLWGVIHDGIEPFPGAIDLLRRLRAEGKRVVLLSNAPRRSAVVAEALTRLGIGADLYDALVTSGEATWHALGGMPGARLYHLGAARDRNVLENRPVQVVDQPEAATLLLNTGPDTAARPDAAIGDYEDVLRRGLEAGLPMLCANPDLEIVSGGRRLICAGALALWYEARHGAVRWIGKPYPEVYDLLWPAFPGLARSDILAVGDALRTDIAGAKAAGIASCWVLGGIHGHADPHTAAAEAEAAGLHPVATIPRFIW